MTIENEVKVKENVDNKNVDFDEFNTLEKELKEIDEKKEYEDQDIISQIDQENPETDKKKKQIKQEKIAIDVN